MTELGPDALVHGACGGAWAAQRVCTRDLAVPTALQRRMSSENSRREMLEIDADHPRRLSATDELVAALDRLALGAAEPVAAGAGGCSPSPGPCPTRGAR